MPVATFSEFVAEQAVTITIGIAAVLVAPKAGPALAELGNDLAARVRSLRPAVLPAGQAMANGRGSAMAQGAAAFGAAVVVPATAAGRNIANAVSGGVHHLAGQWRALIDEAVASETTTAAGPAVAGNAGVLASVSHAVVVSRAPGRVRLRLRSPYNQPANVEQTASALAGMDGGVQTQANTRTGSVLIVYDTGQYATPEVLLTGAAQMLVQRREEERR